MSDGHKIWLINLFAYLQVNKNIRDLKAKSYQDCIGRICDKAQRIYDETLREKLELTHMGQSVVIDVDTGNYYLGETDYLAMKNAREQQPYGLYCIIDIGRVTRI